VAAALAAIVDDVADAGPEETRYGVLAGLYPTS
jgi:hypothetical protein